MQLDDLDFTDDLSLLSQTQQQMQEKTNSVAAASAASQKLLFSDLNSVLSNTGSSSNLVVYDLCAAINSSKYQTLIESLKRLNHHNCKNLISATTLFKFCLNISLLHGFSD
ncbi:unnamed protein product [Schistosoma curassoni]|uniref:Uncharacterized protein n=1 Tax=Schistosoma curassoni TaxID=6186 RepID=A0A183KWS3_9TREM|nr:unnamed protein product [Schistosoma curassoni]